MGSELCEIESVQVVVKINVEMEMIVVLFVLSFLHCRCSSLPTYTLYNASDFLHPREQQMGDSAERSTRRKKKEHSAF
jgi:hypothetical protein